MKVHLKVKLIVKAIIKVTLTLTCPISAIQTMNEIKAKSLIYDKSIKVICKPTKSNDMFK